MYYTDLLNILSIYLQIMNIYIYIYIHIYIYIYIVYHLIEIET